MKGSLVRTLIYFFLLFQGATSQALFDANKTYFKYADKSF